MTMRTNQDEGGSEQVAEGVVEQVEAGWTVQVSITYQLTGKQGFSRTTA